jgi:methyltransferase (TIGR00027 family)
MTRYTRALLKINRNPWIISQSDHAFGLGTMVYTLLRHRWMDVAFERADGPFEQVLVLGAGYDMRAFRLNFGNAKVFEIDHPATGGRKARKVAALGRPDPVHRISVDFSTENLAHALERAGFQKERKSWFFWEGVSMYLPEAAVRSTLTVLSSWGCEGVLDLYVPWHTPDWAVSTVEPSPES